MILYSYSLYILVLTLVCCSLLRASLYYISNQDEDVVVADAVAQEKKNKVYIYSITHTSISSGMARRRVVASKLLGLYIGCHHI